MLEAEVGEAGVGAGVEPQVERLPNFGSSGTEEQQVVSIFNGVTGEASGGGGEVVPEPPFVGGEPFSPGKPAENLALEGGRTPPNHSRHIVNLQMPEGMDIETLV